MHQDIWVHESLTKLVSHRTNGYKGEDVEEFGNKKTSHKLAEYNTR